MICANRFVICLRVLRLQEMYNAGALLDLELYDSAGNSISSHSCVLAAASSVVKEALVKPEQRRFQVGSSLLR